MGSRRGTLWTGRPPFRNELYEIILSQQQKHHTIFLSRGYRLYRRDLYLASGPPIPLRNNEGVRKGQLAA